MSFQRAAWLSFFSVWAVMLTVFTYILGAPALKVLRRRLGRAPYWIVTLAFAAIMVVLKLTPHALTLLSMVTLMGIFEEFEEMGFSFQITAFLTLLINVMLVVGGVALWVFVSGKPAVLGQVDLAMKSVAAVNPQLVVRLPAFMIAFWMIAIYVAILLEGPLSLGEMAKPGPTTSYRRELAEFRVPDVVIWTFILSLLGAFGGFHASMIEAVSANAMFLCAILLFFQGIAVTYKFFETTRVHVVWQVLFMTFVIIQLYLVILVGLTDYWLNFRVRLAKSAEEFKEEA